VHENREQYGADIVALIIDDPQYCGLAWLGPSKNLMYSVTAWDCATGYYSFGHEIGHNLGLNHDRGTKNACNSGGYNYGYRATNAAFRSILAYRCESGQCDNNPGGGCTRIIRFSNPSPEGYNNEPVGNDSNDNARKINDVRVTVAGYYPHYNPFPTVSPAPTVTPPPCFDFLLELLTDNYGSETYWTLSNQAGYQVLDGNGYASNTQYEVEACLEEGCYDFAMYDNYGDGICCSYGVGEYIVTVDGEVVVEGGEFGFSETTNFCGTVSSPSPTASPTCVDSGLPISFQGQLVSCADVVTNNACSNPVAASHCPLSCSTCDVSKCVDSQAPWVVNGNTYDCGDVGNLDSNTNPTLEVACAIVGNTCRGICEYCD